MGVALTERAAKEVQKIITEQKLDAATVLRVGVAGGGCSGFQYSLGFDQKFDEKADSKYGVSKPDENSLFKGSLIGGLFLCFRGCWIAQ